MWYDCQWDNYPQETKITQTLVTIGHRTAFNHEQSPYCIARYKRPRYEKLWNVLKLKQFIGKTSSYYLHIIVTKIISKRSTQTYKRKFIQFLTLKNHPDLILTKLFRKVHHKLSSLGLGWIKYRRVEFESLNNW